MRSSSVRMHSLLVFAVMLFLGTTSCKKATEPEGVQESRVHTRAAWSPDGRQIAFTATIEGVRGIYVIDTNGTNLRRVHQGDAVGIAWSPDGRWLVFSQARTIYKIGSRGDSLTRLTTRTPSIRPCFSPHGTRIAYVRGDEVNANIIVLDLQTMAETDLLFLGNFPSWHPNGNEVVVLKSLPPIYTFYAVHDSTLVARELESFVSSEHCDFAVLSPSGHAALFVQKPFMQHAQVWKLDFTFHQLSQLTVDGGDYPAWSPDGTRIVYTRTAAGDGGLWIMNADGRGARRLTLP